MPLDSDIADADSTLHVEFYEYEKEPYKGKPFVRIMTPGDKNNIVDQPVQEYHKRRFPRQWLYFSMKDNDSTVIGTPIEVWHSEQPETLNKFQRDEMLILKFQTVEQIATASDSQLQKIGMGALGLREKARNYLATRNSSVASNQLEETRKELAEMKQQMAKLMAGMGGGDTDKRGPGRPRKESVDVQYDAPIGDAGHE
jgi:hypothetical protein